MKPIRILIKPVLAILLAGVSVFGQQTDVNRDNGGNAAYSRAKQLLEFGNASPAEVQNRLTRALSDESWYVRGEAARALGRTGEKSVAPLLLPLIKDENWFVRASALDAISRLGVQGDDPTLSPLLASPDSFLRAGGLSVAINRSSDSQTLERALRDSEPIVRRAAAHAAGELKAASAVEALIDLLKDEDPSVRRASATALGRIGDKKAMSAVLATLPEAEADQWEYAAALYRLGKTDYLSKVTPGLKSQYPDVQKETVSLLLSSADNRALPSLLPL